MPAATDGNAVVRHLCAVLVCLLIIRSNEGGFCCVPSVCGVGRLAEDQQYLRWRVGSVACPLCAVLAGLLIIRSNEPAVLAMEGGVCCVPSVCCAGRLAENHAVLAMEGGVCCVPSVCCAGRLADSIHDAHWAHARHASASERLCASAPCGPSARAHICRAHVHMVPPAMLMQAHTQTQMQHTPTCARVHNCACTFMHAQAH